MHQTNRKEGRSERLEQADGCEDNECHRQQGSSAGTAGEPSQAGSPDSAESRQQDVQDLSQAAQVAGQALQQRHRQGHRQRDAHDHVCVAARPGGHAGSGEHDHTIAQGEPSLDTDRDCAYPHRLLGHGLQAAQGRLGAPTWAPACRSCAWQHPTSRTCRGCCCRSLFPAGRSSCRTRQCRPQTQTRPSAGGAQAGGTRGCCLRLRCQLVARLARASDRLGSHQLDCH